MKYQLSSLVAACALIPVMASAQPISSDSTPQNMAGVSVELQDEIRNNFIFVFKNNIKATEAPGISRAMAVNAGGQLGHVYTESMKGFSAKMSATAAAQLAANNPAIAYYEADQILYASKGQPSAKKGKPGGGTTLPPQVTPWGISRVNGGVDGTGLTAWVIDTGIDLDHPDLNVDASRGANFITKGKSSADDGNGHGTHVAGTIAAIDNDIGVIGVAAGATVIPVRVLDNRGSGSTSGVIAGIDFVGANAAPGDVANMSLGGGFSQALNDAIIAAADKGIKFALAAGNEAQHAGNTSPASVNHPNVYTVSAININDVMASFSNFGNPPVDCAAPGVSILSTWNDGGLNTISGTSMAAPHVAGILLLGPVAFDGFASGDPDGNPDPICVH